MQWNKIRQTYWCRHFPPLLANQSRALLISLCWTNQRPAFWISSILTNDRTVFQIFSEERCFAIFYPIRERHFKRKGLGGSRGAIKGRWGKRKKGGKTTPCFTVHTTRPLIHHTTSPVCVCVWRELYHGVRFTTLVLQLTPQHNPPILHLSTIHPPSLNNLPLCGLYRHALRGFCIPPLCTTIPLTILLL